ncbi:unnamed protein product [Dovyalis caffra]|uniref:Uncharacterized protein n=1 Tax=Dovyalis caffra TaxID=77055 RepID=A0AAV1QYX2_9ROSI|nr:unnamed protein product [Dovyalis caffra]
MLSTHVHQILCVLSSTCLPEMDVFIGAGVDGWVWTAPLLNLGSMEMATPEMAYGVPIMSIVGDAFCVPCPVELIIKKKCRELFEVHFEVLYVNGDFFLQVGGSCKNFQKKRIMRDPAAFPNLTMREKKVHRGESSDRTALVFSVQRSHALQMKSRLDIFLANNINEDISNFQVVGCYSSQSCKVYRGDAMIAEFAFFKARTSIQVNNKFSLGKFCEGKDDFRVKVYPGVDYAFILALMVVLNENDIA